ncbi:MAG: prephenate dehydrogenase [Saprospiraceae bacterium]|nr:prephenate dehydrogenase [Saprospiraceae bacterium]
MKVTVIGIGLIGGSMARALRIAEFADMVYGVDSKDEHIRTALDLGIIDQAISLQQAAKMSDLIIVATPVDSIIGIVSKLLDEAQDSIIIDVGSTKSALMQAIKSHPNRGRFVATHPMAGTEYSGPEAAIPDLFINKCTVLVDIEDSDEDAVEVVKNMYRAMQMSMVFHDSVDHDIHTAYVSHISHISSFALALTVLEKEKNEKRIFELAGGGFRSTVRLANSNADTWVPIFEQNRDYVLDVLDEHINTISRFRTLLIKKDFEGFRNMILQANQIKRIVH